MQIQQSHMRILGRMPETLPTPMVVLVVIVVIVRITFLKFWMWQDIHTEDKLVETGLKIGGIPYNNLLPHL